MADDDFRSCALRIAREAIGLPQSTRWDPDTYETEALAHAAKYAEQAMDLLRKEIEHRRHRHAAQDLPHMRDLDPSEARDLREQRQGVRNNFTEPSEAECTHGNRPGECEEC